MKKRVLFLAYRPIFPVTSGDRISMAKDLILLSKYFDVDCVFIADNNSGDKEIKSIKEYAQNVFCFKAPNRLTIMFRLVKAVFDNTPLQNCFFLSKQCVKFIKSNIDKYDLVFCNHIRTAQYLNGIKTVTKKVIDCPDCITLYCENELKLSRGLRRIVFSMERKRVMKFEKENLSSFDHVYLISEKDVDYLLKLNPTIENKTSLLFNYARDLGFRGNVGYSNNNSICFMGKISYNPNKTAILHFARSIFPSLKQQFPDLVFNIYGGGKMSKELKKLNEIEGIVFKGYVEDVALELQNNKFVVAPMISGSGTQNKILESMLLGKLVITTKIGADGLTSICEESSELIIARNDEDMIKKCIFYLDAKNYEEVIEIGIKAREYVNKYYSVDNSERQLIGPINSVLLSE